MRALKGVIADKVAKYFFKVARTLKKLNVSSSKNNWRQNLKANCVLLPLGRIPTLQASQGNAF